MQADQILQHIARIARDKVGFQGTVELTSRLVEDLGLDSIHLMTLAMAVEDHFEVPLDEDDEAAIVTVADLVRVVEHKLSEAQ